MHKFPLIQKTGWILWLLATILMFSGCSEELEEFESSFTKRLTGETNKRWVIQNFDFVFDEESLGTTRLNAPCLFNGTLVFSRQGRALEINTCRVGETFNTTWGVNVANSTIEIRGLEPYDLLELTPTRLVFGFRTQLTFNDNSVWTGLARFTYRVEAR